MTAINSCNTTACDGFSMDGIILGTKSMGSVMKSSEDGQKWASNILKADRALIENATMLHPSNSRQNTYGALVLGMHPKVVNDSQNPQVVKAVKAWMGELSTRFPGRQSYQPADLLQLAADLKASASCIEKNVQVLAANEQLQAPGLMSFKSLIGAMREYADNVIDLHTAVCACPGLDQVILNIPIKQH